MKRKIAAAFFVFLAVFVLVMAGAARAQTIRVDATPSHAVNTFSPIYALGSTVDRVPSNATDTFFRPDQIRKILEAGWGAISYRQNTDLFVQAWHWNPQGKWSDPSGKCYFVGDSTPGKMIRHSYGYSLPHRGFTRNNGTEFDGYSRLDDGDLNTYWKSNPYPTQAFTHEDDSLHPQWVVIDLGSDREVNSIRIDCRSLRDALPGSVLAWANAQGKTSWFGRFLDYLKAHGRLSDLAFMSFEHYPFDGRETPWADLYREPQLLTHIMQVWRDDGLPASVPLLETETNAHGGEAAVDIFGARLGDTFGAFLTAGRGRFTITTCRTRRLIRPARIVGARTTCSW